MQSVALLCKQTNSIDCREAKPSQRVKVFNYTSAAPDFTGKRQRYSWKYCCPKQRAKLNALNDRFSQKMNHCFNEWQPQTQQLQASTTFYKISHKKKRRASSDCKEPPFSLHSTSATPVSVPHLSSGCPSPFDQPSGDVAISPCPRTFRPSPCADATSQGWR